VVLVPFNVRVTLAHLRHALIPVRHADRNAVGLGGRRQVLLRAALRQVEGKFQHAVDTGAGENRFLQHKLALRALKHPAADGRILALGIFAHYVEIDIARLFVGQRAGHARHQTHRAQVHVLVEAPAELDQRTPQRNMIRHHLRHADRAEENRLKALKLLEPVVRHHLAVPQVVVAVGPVERGPFDVDAETQRGGVHRAYAFGHDFLADAVAGDDGDFMGLHQYLLKDFRIARCEAFIIGGIVIS
jgi:hypothetical protein